MTNSHKNIINPFLESSTLLIMTFPEIVESKDLLWGRTCAVDNVRAKEKEYLANCMKYKFHLKGVFAISQLFWHGICSALEYGQEIAGIIHTVSISICMYLYVQFFSCGKP